MTASFARMLRLVLALTALLAAPLGAQQAPAPTSPSGYLFAQLNQERARAGLAPLVWDERLAEAARRHSRRMVAEHNLSHQLPGEPPLPERLAEVPQDHSAENVGFGSDAADLHHGWMNSTGHRHNVLDPAFNAVGVGIVTQNEILWVTQDFARLMPAMDARRAADEAAAAFERERSRLRETPLRRLDIAGLDRLACEMGESGKADAAGVLRAVGARRGVAYSTADPGHLPGSAIEAARTREVDGYAIGACFARSPQYPGGIYWITLALLAGGR